MNWNTSPLEDNGHRFWPATDDKLYTRNVNAKRLERGKWAQEWDEGYLTVHDYTGPKSNRRLNTNFEAPTHLVIDTDRPKDPGEKTKRGATDDELVINKARSKQVKDYLLKEHGWEAINWVCSGNGYHVWYELDGWSWQDVRSVLHYISKKFSDKECEIDTAVCDPARLIRLPGTRNQKLVPGTKHGRKCSIIESATEPIAVSRLAIPDDMLDALQPQGTRNRGPIIAKPVKGFDFDKDALSNLNDVISKTLFAWWIHINRTDIEEYFVGGIDRFKLWQYAGRELINAGINVAGFHQFFQQTQAKYDPELTLKYLNWLLQRDLANAGRPRYEELKPGFYDTLLRSRHREVVKAIAVPNINNDHLLPIEVYSSGSEPASYEMIFRDGKVFNTDSKKMQSCKDFHRWIIENRDVYIHINSFAQFHPTIVQLMLDLCVPMNDEESDEESLLEDVLGEILRNYPSDKPAAVLYEGGIHHWHDPESKSVIVSSNALRKFLAGQMSLQKLWLLFHRQSLLMGPSKQMWIEGKRIRVWQFDPDLWEQAGRVEDIRSEEAVAQSILFDLQQFVMTEDDWRLLRTEQGNPIIHFNRDLAEAWVSSSTIFQMSAGRATLNALAQEWDRRDVLIGPAQLVDICDGKEVVRVFRFDPKLWEHSIIPTDLDPDSDDNIDMPFEGLD